MRDDHASFCILQKTPLRFLSYSLFFSDKHFFCLSQARFQHNIEPIMGFEQKPIGVDDGKVSAHGSSTRNSAPKPTLLPTHRFLSTVAKHTLPFYSVPLHYLKRRGVFLVLLCMGGIAFLHSAYLFPSDNNLLHSRDGNKDQKKNPFMTLNHIREPPSYGSAPVNGVDEDGFEMFVESFADSEIGHQAAHGSKAERKSPRIQFEFEAHPAQNAGARADLIKDRFVTVKGMLRHAWFGLVPTMHKKTVAIRTISQRIQVRGEWIDIMDTLLLARMSDEYEIAKSNVLELTGTRRRLSKDTPFGSHPWRADSQGQQLEVEQQQELEQASSEIQEDINDGINDTKDHGIGFFDTVVRQLGGLLSIYDLERSQNHENPETLKAAVELGDQLSLAFQGPNNALPASTIYER